MVGSVEPDLFTIPGIGPASIRLVEEERIWRRSLRLLLIWSHPDSAEDPVLRGGLVRPQLCRVAGFRALVGGATSGPDRGGDQRSDNPLEVHLGRLFVEGSVEGEPRLPEGPLVLVAGRVVVGTTWPKASAIEWLLVSPIHAIGKNPSLR